MRKLICVASAWFIVCCSAHGADESAPTKDRVGFPKSYGDKYTVLRSIYRVETNQILTVYGNDPAASISDRSQLPYPYGSVLVLEKASAVTDADGNAVLDRENRLRRREILGLHVMRREADFGVDYGKNRTGEWEYVEYRPDGSYITPPSKSFACAECHLKAGSENDWVFHGRFSETP